MRGLPLLLLLAACSKSDPPAPRPVVVEDDPEERCDPNETRVCVGTRVVACEDGKLGRALRQCADTCRKGKCVGQCASGAELIYLVDAQDQLLSFDPRRLPRDPFELIGVMSCSATASPFSMSVDRGGTAWVLYTDGNVYEVSTTDASCKPSGFTARRTFGMGFTSDAPGSKSEKLYIAMNDGSHGLAYLDTTKDVPSAHALATMPYTSRHPELTGTADAKLFGFFPTSDVPAFVQEIDRKTGALVGTRWDLGERLDPSAYAFAQWGGVFYIFVTTGASTVRSIDRQTGATAMVLDNIPYRIVGAGVSTCAPERDQARPDP